MGAEDGPQTSEITTAVIVAQAPPAPDNTPQLCDDLSSEERRLLSRATEEYAAGHYNAAAIRYKHYVSSKRKLTTEPSHLDIIVQYLVCNCLLHSDHFQEFKEMHPILTDLEASVGSRYPMIYYGLSQFYMKVFSFKEADQMADKGLAALVDTLPTCYLPESQQLLPESTLPELKKVLSSIKDQCSGWHRPDVRCFMDICKTTSQNHVCGRDIFLKSPAYNGMVTIICNNRSNPCAIHFHLVCWRVKKDGASSIAKISDKDVLLNWVCFTPNCGTEEHPSLIRKIRIHKEDGMIVDIDPPADKFQWQPQQTTAAAKGVIRKEKKVNKPTGKSAKFKAMSEKIVEVMSEKDGIHHNNHSPGNDNANRSDNSNDQKTAGPGALDKYSSETHALTKKIIKIMALRKNNFNIDAGNDWRPNQAYYGNDHMISTIDTGYEPDFSNDDEVTGSMKAFLFNHFLSFIENHGPIKDEDLMREWSSLIESSDLASISRELPGIIDIRKFLLQSLKFVAIGSYITIPSLLPGAYALVEEETVLKVKNLLENKTFDFATGHIKVRKVEVDKGLDETNHPMVNSSQTASTGPRSDEFLLNSDDNVGDEEDFCEDRLGSSKEEQSLDSQREEGKFIEKIQGDTDNDKVEVAESHAQEPDNPDEGEPTIKAWIEPKKSSEQILVTPEKGENIEEAMNRQIDDFKAQEVVKKIDVNQSKAVPERLVVDAESDGTLSGHDDLPWDEKSSESIQETLCKKCESCKCDNLAELQDTIKSLDKDSQYHREQLRKSEAMLKFTEDELRKTQKAYMESQKDLQKSEIEVQKLGINLQKCQNELIKYLAELNVSAEALQKCQNRLKCEQDEYLQEKRKLTKEMLDTEFRHNYTVISSRIEVIQNQYAAVSKLQNLVYQTTNKYLSVNYLEWKEPLDKLERIRQNLEEENRLLKKAMHSDEGFAEKKSSLANQINMLNFLPLPQRNLPDLIEIGYNMLNNHFQSIVNYRPPGLPLGLSGPPPTPMIPFGYQQSRYMQPTLQPDPYPHIVPPMIPYPPVPRSYIKAHIPRTENYRPLVPTSIPYPTPATSDVSMVSGCIIPTGQGPTATQGGPIIEKPIGTLSAPSDLPETVSVSEDQTQQITTEALKQLLFDCKQVAAGLLPEAQQAHQVANVQEGTAMQGIVSEAVEPPRMASDVIQTHSTSPGIEPAYSIKFEQVIDNTFANGVESSGICSQVEEFFAQAAKVTNAEGLKIPAHVTTPSASSAVECSTSWSSSTVCLATSTPQRVKEPGSTVPGSVMNLPDAPQFNMTAKKLLNAIDSNKKSDAPAENNVLQVNGVDRAQNSNMKSMDKMLHFLRSRHPGVLEHDLIVSVKLVRQNHNNSLSGLPVRTIIMEADNLINSRQQVQTIPYSSSDKGSSMKNQGLYLTSRTEMSNKDSEFSTTSAQSTPRKPTTKLNPWRKLQYLSWIKETAETECIICWEVLESKSKPSYTLNCQHTFHKQCLHNWFKFNRSCPTCRSHTNLDDEFPPLC